MITSSVSKVKPALTLALAVVAVVYFLVAVHNSAAVTAIVVAVFAVKIKVGKATMASNNKDLLELEILINDISSIN
jgi:tetrahydromethanopterin S-methyltransferase subunit E